MVGRIDERLDLGTREVLGIHPTIAFRTLPVLRVEHLLEERMAIEVAQLVEDRLAVVDLDSPQFALPVGEESIGAVVDGGARKLHEKVRRVARLVAGGAGVRRDLPMMGVDIGHHEVRQVFRVPDLPGVAFQIRRGDHVGKTGLLAGHVEFAIEADTVAFIAEGAGAADGVQAGKHVRRRRVSVTQGVERLPGYGHDPLRMQRVGPRNSGRVLTGRSGIPKGICSDPQKADAPMGRIEELRALRLRQVSSPACGNDPHPVHVVQGLQHAGHD